MNARKLNLNGDFEQLEVGCRFQQIRKLGDRLLILSARVHCAGIGLGCPKRHDHTLTRVWIAGHVATLKTFGVLETWNNRLPPDAGGFWKRSNFQLTGDDSGVHVTPFANQNPLWDQLNSCQEQPDVMSH